MDRTWRSWLDGLRRRPDRAQARFADELRRTAGPLPWCVDDVTLSSGWLDVRGWAVPPDGEVERLSILVEGAPADALETGVPREDVAGFFWFLPGADRSGFHARHRTDPERTGHVRLECIDRGAPAARRHTAFINPADLTTARASPPLTQIQRIHGGNSPRQYQVEGYSTFVTLEQVLHRATGRRYDRFGAILDFGCGCGRLTQYFRAVPGQTVYGTDVDAENVEWCRAHLTGSFGTNLPRPPLQLPSGAMDCVVAHDVFSHFGEPDGFDWLRELRRVCAEGALLLITVASRAALARARLSAEHHARVKDLDFIDLSANHDLDGAVEDTTFYRNVFHTPAYIRRRWPGAGFRVVDIVTGQLGNAHDIVVLERTRP